MLILAGVAFLFPLHVCGTDAKVLMAEVREEVAVVGVPKMIAKQ